MVFRLIRERSYLKMTHLLKLTTKYIRRPAIINRWLVGIRDCLALQVTKINIHDVVPKCMASKKSKEDNAMLAKKTHNKQKTAKTVEVVKIVQELISEDSLDGKWSCYTTRKQYGLCF